MQENAEAIAFFGMVSTQWEKDAYGMPEGLNYARVEAGARMAHWRITPELFAKVRHLEREWIRAMRDIAERRRATSK